MIVVIQDIKNEEVYKAVFSKENMARIHDTFSTPIRIRFGNVELNGTVYEAGHDVKKRYMIFKTTKESTGEKSDKDILLEEFDTPFTELENDSSTPK